VEGVDAVLVTVLAGENGGPARRADGVGAEAVSKANAARRDAVDVGGLIDATPIGGDGVRGMVIRHDVQDVGLRTSRSGKAGRGGSHAGEHLTERRSIEHRIQTATSSIIADLVGHALACPPGPKAPFCLPRLLSPQTPISRSDIQGAALARPISPRSVEWATP